MVSQKKLKSRPYPSETMTNTDYSDGLTLLANIRAEAEFLSHSTKQAARGIGLNVNADKTEFMCFKQGEVIFTFKSRPLKVISTYL